MGLPGGKGGTGARWVGAAGGGCAVGSRDKRWGGAQGTLVGRGL